MSSGPGSTTDAMKSKKWLRMMAPRATATECTFSFYGPFLLIIPPVLGDFLSRLSRTSLFLPFSDLPTSLAPFHFSWTSYVLGTLSGAVFQHFPTFHYVSLLSNTFHYFLLLESSKQLVKLVKTIKIMKNLFLKRSKKHWEVVNTLDTVITRGDNNFLGRFFDHNSCLEEFPATPVKTGHTSRW